MLGSISFSQSLDLDSLNWVVWLKHLMVKTETKKSLDPQRSPCCLQPGVLFRSSGGYSFFHLPLLSCVREEALLVIFYVRSQVQLQLFLGFPDPLPALPGPYP